VKDQHSTSVISKVFLLKGSGLRKLMTGTIVLSMSSMGSETWPADASNYWSMHSNYCITV